MTNAEKGILMLTSDLGDGSALPLQYRQFHDLRKRVKGLNPRGSGELTEDDLRRMGISRELTARILSLLDRDEQLMGYLSEGKEYGIHPLTRLDPNYPRFLERKLRNYAPPALFYKGNIKLLQIPCVAVVGSRKIMEENRRFAWRVGELAAKEGFAIVSGGALGADSAAQEACLKNGGKVIVFTPEELDRQKDHPRVLYLSEEAWDLGFSAHRALNRNRLIHAMSEKAFVAQCDYRKGGSWRGAEENLKYGYSPVFVYLDESPGARGLLELGAIAVTDLSSVRELNEEQQTFL